MYTGTEDIISSLCELMNLCIPFVNSQLLPINSYSKIYTSHEFESQMHENSKNVLKWDI